MTERKGKQTKICELSYLLGAMLRLLFFSCIVTGVWMLPRKVVDRVLLTHPVRGNEYILPSFYLIVDFLANVTISFSEGLKYD